MNSYQRFCFNLLGKRMKGRREQYATLRNDLISARAKVPFEVYTSTAVVSSILVGLLMAVVIGVVTYLLNLPSLIKYKGAVPEVLVGLNQYSLLLGTIVATILSLLIFGGLTYVAFLLYPNIEAGTGEGTSMRRCPTPSIISHPCQLQASPLPRFSGSWETVRSMARVP